MARIDVSAYNYLTLQEEAKVWIEESLGESLGDDFWAAIAGKEFSQNFPTSIIFRIID